MYTIQINQTNKSNYSAVHLDSLHMYHHVLANFSEDKKVRFKDKYLIHKDTYIDIYLNHVTMKHDKAV